MEKKLELEVGHSYLTRDGRQVFIYGRDTVLNQYKGVVWYSGEFVLYYEDGRYMQATPDHNDLIMDWEDEEKEQIKQISED